MSDLGRHFNSRPCPAWAVATTTDYPDDKELAVSQPSNQNTSTIRFQREMNSNDWRSLAIVALVLLAPVSYVSAQIGPTTCTAPNIGLNECPSPQYRSGSIGDVFNYHTNTYNTDLTGNPVGDVGVVNYSTVNQLVLLNNTGIFASGHNGCQSPGAFPSPTSSPSIESRIIFPSLVTDNSGTYCAMYIYDLVNPGRYQFLNKLGTTTPPTYVTSSPGYDGDIVVAAEDGNVYAYHFASNTPAWTFTNPQGNPFSRGVPIPFDSSPTVWPNVSYVYVVDVLGDIYYLDPVLGTATYSITTQQVYPGGVNYQGASKPYVPSASSLSVSTSSNTLFVAGSASTGNGVCAYDATNSTNKWCNLGFGSSACNLYSGTAQCYITSSPVVRESSTLAYPLGLVYVQDSGAVLYALDPSNAGGIAWMQPLPNLEFSQAIPTLVGGSPAYDDSANNNTDKYVITTATLMPYCPGCRLRPTNNSMLYVFDATSGAPVCSAVIATSSGPLTTSTTNSSPEVVDGVIYIGTDDGYVLAYQEPPTCAGNNGTTLIPLWQSSTCPVGSQGYPCPMDSGLEGPPVVSFNRVHAVSQKGTLYIWHIPGW